jgi:hypothetical protein
MKIKSLFVRDISSKSLLYYDENRASECQGICDYLRIDFLPLIGEYRYAERSKGAFRIGEMGECMRIGEFALIFSEEFLIRLSNAKHHVLFVTEGRVIKGVVHVSDFNRNIVLQSIQHDVLDFERNLRQWLLLNNVTNDSILAFFEYQLNSNKRGKGKLQFWQRQIDEFNSKKEQGILEKFGQLQHFNLSHLLQFAKSSFSNKLFFTGELVELSGKMESPIYQVILDLRNAAMHAKDSIDFQKESGVHTIDQLQDFYKSINTFISKFEELEQKILSHEKHKRALILDNASKLQIIGEHYPDAIEFFIR